MSADYEILTPETVTAFIARTPSLAALVDAATFVANEVGDGNLNLVFVGHDANGKGLCIKQSLPYVRLVGESWPMTAERIMAEARGLDAGATHAPGLVPDVYHVDPELHLIAMENLAGWGMFRSELNEGHAYPGIESDLGAFVARVAFNTSYFGVEQEEMKQRVADAMNPELCRITEDLVFTEPYIDAERNSYRDELVPEIEAIRADAELRAAVGMLKWSFMTHAEALVHGDLHTGSVMVNHTDDGPTCRVIDPEFAFYGPVGFDLGALFGNFLAARARARVLQRPTEFQQWLESCGPKVWAAFESEMRALWPNRVDQTWTDDMLEAWLAHRQRDMIGFAGAKAIRRIVGLAKVTDIETLEGDQHLAAATIVLRTARAWVRDGAALGSVERANQCFDDVAAEVLG